MDSGELAGEGFLPEQRDGAWRIATPEAFAWWALLHVGEDAVLEADIDLTARSTGDGGGEPLPWPGDSVLSARLDGRGHAVLFRTAGAGLFSEVAATGAVSWLVVGEPEAAAKARADAGGRPLGTYASGALAGGVCGANRGEIEGVLSYAPVESSSAEDGLAVAGIAAVNDGTVKDCASLGASPAAARGAGAVETSYDAGSAAADPESATPEALNAGREGADAPWAEGGEDTGGLPVPVAPDDREAAPAPAASALAATPRAGSYASWNGVGAMLASGFDSGASSAQLALASGGTKRIAKPSGDGTAAAPYQIANAEQLAWFAYKVNNDNANYGAALVELTDDIDLLGADYSGASDGSVESALPWTPIGLNYSIIFKGGFDGGGFSVANMYVTAAEGSGKAEQYGLLGNVDVLTTGNSIRNVSVSGKIYRRKMSTYGMGGVVGFLQGNATLPAVVDCSSTVAIDVTGSNGMGGGGAGGIIGISNGAQIIRCSYVGSLSSEGQTGGIVGQVGNPESVLKDCFSRVSLSSVNDYGTTGGLVGRGYGRAIMVRCYAVADAGDSSNAGKNFGALIGETSSYDGFDATDCYWTSVPGWPSIANAGGWDVLHNSIELTAAQMTAFRLSSFINGYNSFAAALNAGRTGKDPADVDTYASWAFDAMSINDEYPIFAKDAPAPPSSWEEVGKMLDESFSSGATSARLPLDNGLAKTIDKPSGAGTEASPYQIGNAEQFAWYAWQVNKEKDGATVSKSVELHARLDADIDLAGLSYTGKASAGSDYSNCLAWEPIGGSTNSSGSVSVRVSGLFDGSGHTISNLYVPGGSEYNQGLFGIVGDIAIESLTIASGSVVGGAYVSGFVPTSYGTSISISNCRTGADLSIAASLGQCSGFVNSANATVEGCVNEASVTARYVAGCIASYLRGGSIKNCANLGAVRSSDAGNASQAAAGIYSKSSGTDVSVTNCYSAGALDTSGTVAASSPVTTGTNAANCFYDTEKSGAGALVAIDGVKGMTTSQMKSWGAAYTLNGGQGSATPISGLANWRQAKDAGENGGYPVPCAAGETMNAASSWSDVGAWVQDFAPDLAPDRSVNDGTSAGKAIAIENVEQFAWYAWQVNREANNWVTLHARLDSSLSLDGEAYTGAYPAASDYSDCLPWEPIGRYKNSSNYASVSGSFDGNGNALSNLYVPGASSDNQALFGYVDTMNIKALTVESGSVSGATYVAGLVASGGPFSKATITDCLLGRDLSITAQKGVCAGVISDVKTATVKGCANLASIEAPYAASGIAAYVKEGSIKNCANLGSVKATKASSSDGVAAGIYSKYNLNEVPISNCYNAGVLSSAGTYTISWAIAPGNSATNCLYDTGTTGAVTAVSGVKGATTSQMESWGAAYYLNGGNGSQKLESLTAWRTGTGGDFGSYPEPCWGNAHMNPAASWNDVSAWVEAFDPKDASGTPFKPDVTGGTVSIGTPEGLAWYSSELYGDAQLAGKDIALTDDINLFGTPYTGVEESADKDANGLPENIDEALSATGIGNTYYPYTGHFQGNYHEVSNWRAGIAFGRVGLLAEVDGATVENVDVTGRIVNDASVVSYIESAALLVGGSDSAAKPTKVVGCTVRGSFSTKPKHEDVVGGVFGAGVATIYECDAHVNIATNGTAGGIAGRLEGASSVGGCWVEESSITATSSSSNASMGGIVGSFSPSGNDASVEQCSADATTVEGRCSGGIVGGMSKGVVRDCWSNVTVKGDAADGSGRAGGILGQVDVATSDANAVAIENCYARGTLGVNAGGAAKGGILGAVSVNGGLGSVSTTAKIQNCYFDKLTAATTDVYGEVDKGFDKASLVITTSEGRDTLSMRSLQLAAALGAGRASSDQPWCWSPLQNGGYPDFGGSPAPSPVTTWEQVAELQQEDALRRTEVVLDADGRGSAGEVHDAIPSGGDYTAALSGAGTQSDPYVVSTPEAFAWYAWQVNQDIEWATAMTTVELHVRLGADIDLAGLSYTGNSSVGSDYSNCLTWRPVGGYTSGIATSGVLAAGSLDGDGHAVSNLYVPGGSSHNQGLFGVVETMAVEDLSIASGSVSGGAYVAGFVPTSDGGTVTITDCRTGADLSITSSSGECSGFVNWAAATVEGCVNEASVTASHTVGGIASYLLGGSIENCANLGAVRATKADVANQAAAGIYSSSGKSDVSVANCYSAGALGTAGTVVASSPITTGTKAANCLYDAETTGNAKAIDGVKGMTTSQMKSWGAAYQLNGGQGSATPISTLANWRQARNSADNGGYPAPCRGDARMNPASQWSDVAGWVEAFDPKDASGTPFKPDVTGSTVSIGTPEGLAWYSLQSNVDDQLAGKDIELTGDIDLFGTPYSGIEESLDLDANGLPENIDSALVTMGIGGSYYPLFYTGRFQGNDRTVRNWHGYPFGYAGLLGGVNGATVENVNVVGKIDSSDSYSYLMGAALLVGGSESTAKPTTVKGCTVRGSVSSKHEDVMGGVFGAGVAVISDCQAQVDVATLGTAGGIAGSIDAGTALAVSDCAATGTVEGTQSAGGIAGETSGQAGTVGNCYSSAEVRSSSGAAYGVCPSGATRCFYDKDRTPSAQAATGVWALATDEMKGRIDMAAADAPEAGLGGTNVIDVLNTTDSGERTGADRVWYPTHDALDSQGYPSFERFQDSITKCTLDPSKTTSKSGDSAEDSLSEAKLLRPVRLLEGDGTSAFPYRAPEFSLAPYGDVRSNWALWAGGDGAGASADKRIGLSTVEGLDLRGLTGAGNASLGDEMSGYVLDAAAAYSVTAPRTVLVDAAFDDEFIAYETVVTIKGVTARTLDVTAPVEASFGSLSPDAGLHEGADAALSSADSIIRNNGSAPVAGSATGVDALPAGESTGAGGVSAVLPTADDAPTANNRPVDDGTNARLGLTAAQAPGLATLASAVHASAIVRNADGSTVPGTLPMSFSLAAVDPDVDPTAELRRVGFRWMLEYSGTWTGVDGARFGYAASYSFGPAAEDLADYVAIAEEVTP